MDTTYTDPRAVARPAPVPRTLRLAAAVSDADLVAASVRDPGAFTALFERHWDGLSQFCFNRAGAAGEDIAAEAFRVAFDRRRRYDTRYRDARPWLFGIATNLLREHFRAAQREERKLERSAAREPIATDDNELCGLERRLLGSQMAAALQDIPAGDRDALLLLAWADLSYEQIAEALGVPLGTVRSRIHRARQRVSAYLDAAPDPLTDRKA